MDGTEVKGTHVEGVEVAESWSVKVASWAGVGGADEEGAQVSQS